MSRCDCIACQTKVPLMNEAKKLLANARDAIETKILIVDIEFWKEREQELLKRIQFYEKTLVCARQLKLSLGEP